MDAYFLFYWTLFIYWSDHTSPFRLVCQCDKVCRPLVWTARQGLDKLCCVFKLPWEPCVVFVSLLTAELGLWFFFPVHLHSQSFCLGASPVIWQGDCWYLFDSAFFAVVNRLPTLTLLNDVVFCHIIKLFFSAEILKLRLNPCEMQWSALLFLEHLSWSVYIFLWSTVLSPSKSL